MLSEYNLILEKEISAYRFIGKELTPISDQTTINQIERTKTILLSNRLAGAYEHIQSAIEKLSDRTSPDYRNSIKESISAVETICKIIAQDERADLIQALKKIKEKLELHKNLELALIQLYCFTSDEGGVRHSLIDESNVDQEDAIFMLASCSAFIHYLIVKGNKAGLLPKHTE
jgi:hypothetical protein